MKEIWIKTKTVIIGIMISNAIITVGNFSKIIVITIIPTFCEIPLDGTEGGLFQGITHQLVIQLGEGVTGGKDLGGFEGNISRGTESIFITLPV